MEINPEQKLSQGVLKIQRISEPSQVTDFRCRWGLN